MKPTLRTIKKVRRASTVSRRAVRAAVKAVMAERTPELEAMVQGKPLPKPRTNDRK